MTLPRIATQSARFALTAWAEWPRIRFFISNGLVSALEVPILGSKSWRVTAPARRIKRSIRNTGEPAQAPLHRVPRAPQPRRLSVPAGGPGSASPSVQACWRCRARTRGSSRRIVVDIHMPDDVGRAVRAGGSDRSACWCRSAAWSISPWRCRSRTTSAAAPACSSRRAASANSSSAAALSPQPAASRASR